MRIVIAAFTAHGVVLERKIAEVLQGKNLTFRAGRESEEEASTATVELYASEKYCGTWEEVQPIWPSLKEWTGSVFSDCDALIFISASGIAVRAIAPFVRSKKEDPAVICMDEQAKFCISLLSGHIGGANELCRELCEITGAVPVITTATDTRGLFAVDVFAVKNRLAIREMLYAKEVSAALVDGQTVGFYSEPELEGELPQGLVRVADKQEAAAYPIGICISYSETKQVFAHTLHLVPKDLTVGIGCKKNTEAEQIEKRLQEVLAEEDISCRAIRRIVSIDLKSGEPGLLSLCEKYHWPFQTYSSEVLKNISGDFTPSVFVKSVTGVDNVCERSAVCEGGTLLIRKHAGGGVTIAAAAENRRIRI